MNIPQPIIEIIDTLSSQYEVYYVGGCVRDALLGKPIHDYDCTTNATPDQMKEVLKDYKIINTGEKHGTLTIMNKNLPVEITTYRTEYEYIQHRKPSNVSFSMQLKDDLIRRDFTINALVYHPQKGIVDLVDGLHDINNQIIRAIGEPEKRFEEDALRILRAIRFALQLDFSIETHTKEAILKTKHYLDMISKERCRDELKKILAYPHALSILKEYELCEFFMIDENADEKILDDCQDDIFMKLALLYKTQENAEKAMKYYHFSNKEIKDVLSFYQLSASLKNDKKSMRRLIYQTKGDIEHARRILHYNQFDDTDLNEILEEKDYFIQLNINGKDCIELNIEPLQINTMLQKCLDYCLEDITRNENKTLKEYIKK